jgi:dihydropteroate synthase
MVEIKQMETRRLLPCRGMSLALKRTPLVMGIVNVTPDSFSDGGEFLAVDKAIEHARRLAEEGADIIDIGGESTRPGSDPVPADEEMNRVLPVVEALVPETRIPISIDTRKPEVARAALEAGCHIVNDVSACADGTMAEVIAAFDVPVVIMHMRGDPKTMQVNPRYEDVVSEVKEFLRERAERLIAAGVKEDRIIIDPGIGFGKRFRDNLELIKNIAQIRSLGYPVLVGASRKRFLGEVLDAEVDERLYGSLAVAAHCYFAGVDIIRVHDVRATREILAVLDALSHPEDYSAEW